MKSLFSSLFTRGDSAGCSVFMPSPATPAVMPDAQAAPPPVIDTDPITMPQPRHFPAAILAQPGIAHAEAVSLSFVHLGRNVQIAAHVLQQELHRLIDASILGLISLAVHRAGVPMSEATPSLVQDSLQALRADVHREIESARHERAAHEAAFREVLAPILQLRKLVGDRAAAAAAEAKVLRTHASALSEWRPGEVRDRGAALRELLTPKELAAVGIPDSTLVAADMNAQAAKLEALVVACDRFNADECFSVHHLDGLGFDAEIEAARVAGEVRRA